MTSEDAAQDPDLIALAEEFADSLTTTVRGILGPEVPRFAAIYVPKSKGKRHLVVRTQSPRGQESPPIPIMIHGLRRLDLIVELRCTWDGHRDYLAIEKSAIAVRMTGTSEPLFRWEFLRSPLSRIPSAHFQIHAHRDEIVYLLLAGGATSPRAVKRAGELASDQPDLPRVCDVHIPLGGARFRPCLEDVLQFLIEEFGISCQNGWRPAIEAGRLNWRKIQAGAVARDFPDEAARVLESLGYEVTAPKEKPATGSKIAQY